MRVAVTGADGFVGRHLCPYLSSRGDTVLSLPGPQPIGLPPGVEALDVTDEKAVRARIEALAPDAIVHLAGLSAVGRSHQAPAETLRVNTIGTAILLGAVRDLAPKARVLVVSSGEVYGPILEGHRAREGDTLAPTSPYAVSKAAAELVATQFHRAYGTRVVVARPFNHLGAGQSPEFAIPAFARQLAAMHAAGRGTLAVGNLDPVRDFSHVGDVCAAYALLLDRGTPGETYNVASGAARTIRSIVEEMIAVSGVDATIEVDPARVRPVDLPRLVGDASKLASLGWTPRQTVREALRAALEEARQALRKRTA